MALQEVLFDPLHGFFAKRFATEFAERFLHFRGGIVKETGVVASCHLRVVRIVLGEE